MYAIVEIAGQQLKVSEGQEVFVHRLEGKSGDKMKFKNIHLTHNDKDIKVGSAVKGTVNATLVEHLKGEKVIVFKKKRRKGYQVKNGHRQYLTKIKIDSIH